MIHFFMPSHRLFRIPALAFATFFVALDIVSFVVQLIGGSMVSPQASAEQKLKGIRIYMGGIGMQQAFIVIFTILTVGFHCKMSALDRVHRDLDKIRWKPLVFTVYTSLGLITVSRHFKMRQHQQPLHAINIQEIATYHLLIIRNLHQIRIIYRLVEFSPNSKGSSSLADHEAYFYILEGVPMLFALLAFNIVNPGGVLDGPKADMPGLWTSLRGRGGWTRYRSFKMSSLK
jgi:hypothetical protein